MGWLILWTKFYCGSLSSHFSWDIVSLLQAPQNFTSPDSYVCHLQLFSSFSATAFGEGVYFAVQAQYSCSNTYSRPDPNGMKRLYLSKVLTGEFCMGKGGMRVPPQKPGGAAHALYDSVVNNVANPGMFIIFNDTQAYPDYLVAFKQ